MDSFECKNAKSPVHVFYGYCSHIQDGQELVRGISRIFLHMFSDYSSVYIRDFKNKFPAIVVDCFLNHFEFFVDQKSRILVLEVVVISTSPAMHKNEKMGFQKVKD